MLGLPGGGGPVDGEFLKVLVVYPSSTLGGKLFYSVNYSLVWPGAPLPLPLPRSLSISGPAS